jgi:hypothetical protein
MLLVVVVELKTEQVELAVQVLVGMVELVERPELLQHQAQ